ncbi:GAF and ANTAR domain-containing protein [Pedococcus bigeumensis]|uniref:GAF and ANTAR domain-containing protein n=1 Tax=Pedococcus bigeumensis TaxID=433644 RepID=UPI002FED9D72
MPPETDARVARANQLIDDEPTAAHPRGPFGRMEQLCSALSRHLPARGVGVSVLTEDTYSGGTVAASDAVSRRLDELQFTLGEGPCIDAYATRRPVFEPDLFGHGSSRWPGYAAAAQDEGVRAVFAFPLTIGTARAGALDVYRTQPGPLTKGAVSQAMTFAEIAMGLLLDTQAESTTGSERSADLDDALAYRLEVYQAQGMVMVDLGVSLDEAMVRLRAHAYANDRSLADVARDVVQGSLRMSQDNP